jgi:hypothetical protein
MFNKEMCSIKMFPYHLLLSDILYGILQQVSYRFFELTNRLKNAFVPHKDNARLYQIATAGAIICITLYAVAQLTINLPKLLVCSCVLNFNSFPF